MMKRWVMSLSLVLFAVTLGNAAQLYRWVDSKGNVEWRDTPPPASAPAKKIEQRKVGDNVISTTDQPYEVQLAMKNHPVTLWVMDCGPPCTSARTHLERRGIPYTEKAPQSDLENFKKISPASEVPILLVGRSQLKGYQQDAWDSALDTAGYPRTASVVRRKPAATAPKPPAESAKPAADGAPAAPAPGQTQNK